MTMCTPEKEGWDRRVSDPRAQWVRTLCFPLGTVDRCRAECRQGVSVSWWEALLTTARGEG